MSNLEVRARVGTSAWDKPHWRGHFYPPGLPRARRLAYAAERMTTLEVNTTFYGSPAPSTFSAWRAQVPDDFVFSVKGSRVVTHDRRLEDAARAVAEFFACGVLLLREKLGPVLWQVPASLGFRPETVDAFLSVLPHSVGEARRLAAQCGLAPDPAQLALPDRPIRQCLEVRGAGFRDHRFVELLRRHDVAAVVTNSPGWPTIDEVTSDFVYVRLHGDAGHFPDGYDDVTIDAWADRVTAWLRGSDGAAGAGRDVFVYFDNPDGRGIRSPSDAIRLQTRVGGGPPGAAPTVQPPLWGDCTGGGVPGRASRYQATGPRAETKAPVGPSGASCAIRTMISAPSSTVWVPVPPLRSVLV